MRHVRRLATLCLAWTLLFVLGGCTGLGKAKDDHTLTIGISFDQPGLGLKENGTYSGFDVDVARFIGKQMGYAPDQIKFKEAPTAQRENLLVGGQVDLVIASYSITEARKQLVDFVGPYMETGAGLLVRQDSTITGVKDLEGKVVCSASGSTSSRAITQIVPSVTLREFDSFAKCVDALQNSSVDAVTSDEVILAGLAARPQSRGQVKLVGTPFTTEDYGIGLHRDDPKLCQRVRTALETMIKQGAWARAVSRNLGPSGYATPRPPRVAACR